MSRQLVSSEELVNILNRELLGHDTCQDCSFSAGMKLSAERADGCNWSDPHLRCSGVRADTCLQAANHVVQEAQRRYNLV
jgi:hypothetical protein